MSMLGCTYSAPSVLYLLFLLWIFWYLLCGGSMEQLSPLQDWTHNCCWNGASSRSAGTHTHTLAHTTCWLQTTHWYIDKVVFCWRKPDLLKANMADWPGEEMGLQESIWILIYWVSDVEISLKLWYYQSSLYLYQVRIRRISQWSIFLSGLTYLQMVSNESFISDISLNLRPLYACWNDEIFWAYWFYSKLTFIQCYNI